MEWQYDDNTVFSGMFIEMMDYIGGDEYTQIVADTDVANFTITVWIRGIPFDVTDSIRSNSPKLYDRYEEEFHQYAIKQRSAAA